MVQILHQLEKRNHCLPVARNIRKTHKRLTSAAATPVVRAELNGDNCCGALGFTVPSSSPVPALCQKLGRTGTMRPLEVYGGGTLVLHVKSIGQAVKLERLRAAPPIAPVVLTNPHLQLRARAMPPCPRALFLWRQSNRRNDHE